MKFQVDFSHRLIHKFSTFRNAMAVCFANVTNNTKRKINGNTYKSLVTIEESSVIVNNCGKLNTWLLKK